MCALWSHKLSLKESTQAKMNQYRSREMADTNKE